MSEQARELHARWEAFHAAHPWVYGLFRRFAREAQRARVQRMGARLIWERIRWFHLVEMAEKDPQLFAQDDRPILNDHFIAFYARLLAREHPELGTLFEFRRSMADETL